MAFPSLRRLAREAFLTFQRFPMVIAAGIVAAIAGIIATDGGNGTEPPIRLMCTALLGFPLGFALRQLSERRQWPAGRTNVARLVAALALAGFYFLWPGWRDDGSILRYLQISVGLHLSVAFLPFVGTREVNGFWQYNRILLERFLIAAVFSTALYIGLVVALLAVDNLLGVGLPGDAYFWLWLLVAFVFHPWFFLGDIPNDLSRLEARHEYPSALKIFAQYILAPLVTTYLVILTIYFGKILITTTWPSGWIGYLVSSAAGVGVLSLLLLYPAAQRQENQWVAKYARWFYIGVLPSVVMLLLAIWKRIDQYGVTEKRYLLVVLTIWFAGVAIYSIITRSNRIRFIPVSLCLVAFGTAFGPWGAYAVSRHSQTARLQGLLEKNVILVDGTIRESTTEVPYDDRREISATLRYLLTAQDTTEIAEWFDGRYSAIDTIGAGGDVRRFQADERARLLTVAMGISYVNRWETPQSDQFAFGTGSEMRVFPIREYDYTIQGNFALPFTAPVDSDSLTFGLDDDGATIMVTRGADTLITIPLARFIQDLRDAPVANPWNLPPERLQLVSDNGQVRMLTVLRQINGVDEPTGPRITQLRADFYIKLPPANGGN